MSDKATKNSAIIVSALTAFLAPFMVSGVNIALPAIQKEFSIDAIVLSWIVTLGLLTSAIFLIPVGKIADIYGRKKILILGLVIFFIFNFLCAFSRSIEVFIFFRIMSSIGTAMLLTSGIAMLTSVFPVRERGKALGFTIASTYTGLSAGPFIGGLLTQYFGWRSIFIAISPIGLICIILAVLFLKGEWADARGEKLDVIGCVTYGFSLVLFMYGISLLPGKESAIYILLGLAGFFAFVIRELKIEYPVFEVRLFKHNRVFAFSSLAALISYAATYATAFLLSLYLQYIIGFSPKYAGLVIAAQPVMQAVFSPFAGKLSDKVEPAIIASIGMGFTVLGLFLLIFIRPETPLIFLVVILIILGIGYALFSSPNTNAIMSSVEKKYYGIASGAVSTMRSIGMLFSMAVTTILFSLFIGKVEITPAVYPAFIKSFRIAFIIFTILCASGIFFSSVRGNLHGER
jgi:EmrB/QacA subfamily drug resistance transporter